MKASTELAKSALKAARNGWYLYLSTLWLLILVLYIDFISGQQFIFGKEDISLFDLEVPRSAFSFSYSALIGVFAFWAAGSARTIQKIVSRLAEENLLEDVLASPEYQLWGLSPINPSAINRRAFWVLSGVGLILLFNISIIHLAQYNLPPPENMNPETYQRIGMFSLAVLVLSLYLSIKWIYPAWNRTFSLFSKDENY